jgi:hypothetical protein
MKAYRIVDWDTLYENNRTRDMKAMQWVPVPIKHDGCGYLTLIQKDGAARLGAWLAILQTAAKSHPRGTLLRNGRNPHTAETIALVSRLDVKIIQETLDACVDPSVEWIEVVDVQGDKIQPAENPHPTAVKAQEPARKGREGKGREEKGTFAPTSGARARNPVMDALGSLDGNIQELNKAAWAKVGTALKSIREVCPDVTAEQIERRANNYRSHFGDAVLSSNALAKHWARCGSVATKTAPPLPTPDPGTVFNGDEGGPVYG